MYIINIIGGKGVNRGKYILQPTAVDIYLTIKIMDVLFFVRKGKVPKETPALMFHKGRKRIIPHNNC